MQPLNPQVIPAITLDAVKTQFAHWRKTRPHVSKIPVSLWAQVFLLVGHYPTRQILDTLGLSSEQFRNAKFKRSNTLDQSGKPVFVELNSKVIVKDFAATPPADNTAITVEYKRIDGASLTIKDLPISHLSQLLQSFNGKN